MNVDVRRPETPVQVTMVGELTQVQDKGTQTDLVLNDGTGAADVKVFITGDEDPVSAHY
jgi:DNA/RNA endonuclease YhcR with UshA esterase domain